MKMEFKVRTEVRGPLFDNRGLTKLGQAVNGGIRELVQMGEERLAHKFRPQGSTNLEDNDSGIFLSVEQVGKKNASQGHYRRNIKSKMKDLHAVIEDGMVVYGPWLEGIGSRNGPRPRFPGYRQFRITENYLQKKSNKVFTAHLSSFVRKMNA
jgi:hypothetical protein